MLYKERFSSNTAVQGEADAIIAMETSLSSAAHVKAFFRAYKRCQSFLALQTGGSGSDARVFAALQARNAFPN